MRKIYFSESLDPYFNLAFEEHLLKTGAPGDEVLYLWQNEKTVVIGRNQNPWKECNLPELENMGGRLVRRLSGGGAVYHDFGNLNYTFISDYHENKVKENVELIIRVLNSFGIQAVFSGKNDIVVGEFKVSGNAYMEDNGRLCHHGTLLVNADLEQASRLLTVSKLKLESKGIDSVRARIKNLKEFRSSLTIDDLKIGIAKEFSNREDFELEKEVSEQSMAEILELSKHYMSSEWNFGSTPEFDICVSSRDESGEVDMYLKVVDGIVVDVRVSTDSLDVNLPDKLYKKMIFTRFAL